MWPNPFAKSTVVDTRIYYPQRNGGTASSTGTTSIASWQTWTKPNGCTFVYMLIIAAGGGGGRPAVGATTSAGGGGGSGGHTRLIIPAMFLPETLFVWPGSGGLGATTTATAGAQGQPCIIACEPNNQASNTSAPTTMAGYVLEQAGGLGGAAASTAGGAGLIADIRDQHISGAGLWFSIGGHAGQAGALATNGNGVGISGHTSGVLTTGGAGGGNGTGSGGAINSTLLKVNIAASTSGQAGKTGVGYNHKIEQLISRGDPLYFSGGSGGGGSQTATTAGAGGNAGYGGGGGGGGSSSSTGASGNGGDGGDGLIIIMSW